MAHTLLVSFEIKWDEDGEYDQIYNDLQTAIKAGLSGADWWCQTTSFYVLRTEETSQQFLSRVWRAAGMRKDKDILFAFNANLRGGAIRGAVTDQDIFPLLPVLKAV